MDFMKTSPFLCHSYPAMKTIRWKKISIPGYLTPKLSLKWNPSSVCGYWNGVQPALLPWQCGRWMASTETTRWAKIQATELLKIWENTRQAEMSFHLPDLSFFMLDLGKDRTVQPKSSMDSDGRPDPPTWMKAQQKELGRWPVSTGGNTTEQEWGRGIFCTESRWQQGSVGWDHALRHADPAHR